MKNQRTTSALLAILFLFASAVVAQETSRMLVKKASAPADKENNYRVTILVASEEDEAPLQDTHLVNAWGIAASDSGPWWVADNATGFSTIYTGDGAKLGEVVVPGAPTGTVFNGGGSFQLAPNSPALFLFASEDGTFSAWNPSLGGSAVVVFNDPGSIYKGMAIHGDVLYSTDFSECKVEAFQGNFFDGTFDEFETAGEFEDDSIPAGFCPFGIQAIGNSIFVTYAKKAGEDDEAGIGHGFVREFDTDGNLVAKVASHGLLNSPWGIAKAPQDFGKFSGCLLVGNFGDGKINGYCQNNGGEWHHAGHLREGRHSLAIDGLWGIGFGNGGVAGPPNVLYFAAGPDDETEGYYGRVDFEP
ncbi:MAG TPA: TIGR03118 family protein [Thermoanaerobaculia bacterium]